MKTLCTMGVLARWQPDEIEIVRENYSEIGPAAVADMLPLRSERSVVCLAARLNIKFNAWTDNEEAIIRRLFPLYGAYVTANSLPRRTYHAVRLKAKKMGLSCDNQASSCNGDMMNAINQAFHRAWV